MLLETSKICVSLACHLLNRLFSSELSVKELHVHLKPISEQNQLMLIVLHAGDDHEGGRFLISLGFQGGGFFEVGAYQCSYQDFLHWGP